MRGVVRARVNATRFRMIGAEIAGSGFLPYHRHLAPRCSGIIGFDGKRVQINVAVRAVFRAQAAADAPVFNDDFQRIAPADGADRTADHAKRVAALTT